MDYEKKYKEALERARQFSEHPLQEDSSNIVEYIFPELQESKDERIRKEIIETFKILGDGKIPVDINYADIFTWLEKQEGCEYIKKDWLEHIKQSWYKEGFIDGKYSGGTSKEWTINDAATLKELIDFLENGTEKLQHDLTKYANWLKIQFTPIEKQGEQKPAWSEEDEQMIGKIRNIIENYAFSQSAVDVNGDLCEKEYIDTDNWLKFLKDRVQPKQEWKQENTDDLTDFENAMMHIGVSFFGENAGLDPNNTDTIKEQAELLLELAPKQEWSEEDKDFMYDTLSNLTELKDRYGEGYGNVGKCIDWLKILKQRIGGKL